MPIKPGIKVLAENRKARHEYFIESTYECGIALVGTEVKSIRMGKVNIKDSYVRIKNGEAFVIGMHVSPYEKGNIFNRDPFRERKLLLHKREIRKLLALSQADGYSLIPLKLYLRDGKVKLELAVARVKNSMTSVMILPSATQGVQWIAETAIITDGRMIWAQTARQKRILPKACESRRIGATISSVGNENESACPVSFYRNL